MRYLKLSVLILFVLFSSFGEASGRSVTVGSAINTGLKASGHGGTSFNNLATTLYILYKSSLPLSLRNVTLGTKDVSASDWKSLRKKLDDLLSKNNPLVFRSLSPAQKSFYGRIMALPKAAAKLKLAVATLFVAQRAVSPSDWFDCTTRTVQVHAQAMYLARFEGNFRHVGSKRVKNSRRKWRYVEEPMGWRDVLNAKGNLRGSGAGNVLARRLYLSAMYKKDKAPVRWLGGWKNVAPWAKGVRVGDVVANLRGKKVFHLGTIVYINHSAKIAAVLETYLKRDKNRRPLKTPTHIWVYYQRSKSRRQLPKNFIVPGFEKQRHLYRFSGRVKNHFGATGIRIGRYKDTRDISLSLSPTIAALPNGPRVKGNPLGQGPKNKGSLGLLGLHTGPTVPVEPGQRVPAPERVIVSDPSGMFVQGILCGNELIYDPTGCGVPIVEELANPMTQPALCNLVQDCCLLLHNPCNFVALCYTTRF